MDEARTLQKPVIGCWRGSCAVRHSFWLSLPLHCVRNDTKRKWRAVSNVRSVTFIWFVLRWLRGAFLASVVVARKKPLARQGTRANGQRWAEFITPETWRHLQLASAYTLIPAIFSILLTKQLQLPIVACDWETGAVNQALILRLLHVSVVVTEAVFTCAQCIVYSNAFPSCSEGFLLHNHASIKTAQAPYLLEMLITRLVLFNWRSWRQTRAWYISCECL